MSNQVFTSQTALVPILDGLFDYAGLFPPASLEMDAAVSEYLGHRGGSERYMVGPFVVPAARLHDMQRAFEVLGSGTDFTLLPRPVTDPARDTSTLEEDFRAARRLEQHTDLPFRCVAVESRIPVPMVDAAAYASLVRIALENAGLEPARVFLEIPRGDDFEARLGPYFDALVAASGRPLFAGKLRCGGSTPADYPSSREIALFILAGIRVDCPFKFTAGLHHPFRHFSDNNDVIMHGFVNVVVATTVGAAIKGHVRMKNDPSQGDDVPQVTFDAPAILEQILEEYTPQKFRFVGNNVRWESFILQPDALRRVRSELALGIGSCSIREPLEDLSHYFPPLHT